MSSAKANRKRWAIVPPASDTSDAVGQQLNIQHSEAPVPETLRSRPGLGVESWSTSHAVSGEYLKADEAGQADGSAPGAHLSRPRSPRPKGMNTFRERETVFEEVTPGGSDKPEEAPVLQATLVSPGQRRLRRGSEANAVAGARATTPAQDEEALSPATRKRTGRRRIDYPQTQNSIPDAVLAAATERHPTATERQPGATQREPGEGDPRPQQTLRSRGRNAEKESVPLPPQRSPKVREESRTETAPRRSGSRTNSAPLEGSSVGSGDTAGKGNASGKGSTAVERSSAARRRPAKPTDDPPADGNDTLPAPPDSEA